jgi:hypothetical protein
VVVVMRCTPLLPMGKVYRGAARDARTARREIGTSVTSGWGATGDGYSGRGRVGRAEARRGRGEQMARGSSRYRQRTRWTQPLRAEGAVKAATMVGGVGNVLDDARMNWGAESVEDLKRPQGY